MFDLVGSEERTIAGILDTVEVDVERDDVPLVGVVLTNVHVIAHDGAEFSRPAKSQFDWRLRADTREINGAVAGAADAIEVFVERFVEHHAYVGAGARSDGVEKEKGQRDGERPHEFDDSTGRSYSPESAHKDKNPGAQ